MKKLNSTHASSRKRTADIINAALRCFTEIGYNDTTMTDICKAANASTGSVYHHFKSKEQLAAAVFLDGISQYQAGMLSTLEKKKDAPGGIKSIIAYHMDWVRNNPDWARFLFQKKYLSFSTESETRLAELNKEFVTGMAGWFKKYMDEGTIRPMPWDMLISLLLGPCQEYTKLYLSKKNKTGPDEAVSVLSRAVWRSISSD